MQGEDACLGFVVQKHGNIKEKLLKTSALLTEGRSLLGVPRNLYFSCKKLQQQLLSTEALCSSAL